MKPTLVFSVVCNNNNQQDLAYQLANQLLI